VLTALRLDTGQLPAPRADGDREALRTLLVARQEITVARTAQIGQQRQNHPAPAQPPAGNRAIHAIALTRMRSCPGPARTSPASSTASSPGR
jgi:hypothetical protein